MKFLKKITFLRSKRNSSRKNVTCLGNNELSLGKGPSFMGRNATSLGNNELSSKEGPSSPRKHMFRTFLQP
jgi:hypothetical protein